MKNIIFFTIFITICPYVSSNQKTDWQQDLLIYKTNLEKMHPSLYDYISKPQFKAEFNKIYNQEVDTIEQAFIQLSKLNAKIGDGHADIILPEGFFGFIAETKKIIPVKINIKDNDIYAKNLVDEKFLGKIFSINDKKPNDILKDMRDIISSDANNIYFKNNKIKENFALYYYLLYGETNDFIFKYLSTKDSSIKTKKIPAKYGKDIFDDEILSYTGKKINDDTFLLDIDIFIFENQQNFENFLSDTFKKLKKDKKIKKIIIDVQDNPGGLRENAILLYSYLTDKPFKQRIQTKIISNKVNTNNLINMDPEDVIDLQSYLNDIYGKSLSNKNDHLQYLMLPNKNNWNKEIEVLMNGGTFSAGCEFALLAKNNPKIKLTGKPCGLNYYQHNGDINLVYELPNSKLIMAFSMVKILHFVNDKSVDKNSVVIPDEVVK
jgi:hypothetical protein